MGDIYQVNVIVEGKPLAVIHPPAEDASAAIGKVMYTLYDDLRGKEMIEIKAGLWKKGKP